MIGLSILLGIANGVLPSAASAKELPAMPASVTAISDGLATFGVRLLVELSTRQPGHSVVVSPYGLATALAMTSQGAAGATRSTLTDLLGLGEMASGQLADGHQMLRDTLTTPGATGSVPTIANSLWAGQGMVFAESFLSQQREAFGATFETLHFEQPEAVKRINDWVATATSGKISKIVEELPATTPLVLVNAVHFKGAWQVPFAPADTKEQPFTLSDGSQRMVPLMIRRNASLAYQEMPDYQAVTLPYDGERFGLTVVLPTRNSEMPSAFLERTFNHLSVSPPNLLRPVTLSLPRLSLTFDAELRSALEVLGAGLVFTSSADFSAMTTTKVMLDRVLHAASLIVDEYGTEVAAATAVMVGRSLVLRATVMTVDRPYYLLLHTLDEPRTLLFLAYIADPGPLAPGP
ncbi:putative Uncharacterized serpin-like protein TK1782 [Gammaproteobacteria bacterium]